MRRRNVKKEKKIGSSKLSQTRNDSDANVAEIMSRNRVFWKGLPLRYPLSILLRSLSPKIANANNRGKDRPWLHRENERNEEGQPREACEE